jgi:hypothetical protein
MGNEKLISAREGNAIWATPKSNLSQTPWWALSLIVPEKPIA